MDINDQIEALNDHMKTHPAFSKKVNVEFSVHELVTLRSSIIFAITKGIADNTLKPLGDKLAEVLIATRTEIDWPELFEEGSKDV